MNQTIHKKPKILILFSDTGGGHRSAAEAIIEALEIMYPEEIDIELIDFFKQYSPPPFNYLPNLYPAMVRIPQAWGMGYRLSNGGRQSRLLVKSTWLYVRRSVQQLINQHPSDLVISVHPVSTAAYPSAFKSRKIPFITVVTDLVTTHAFWYNHNTDLCLVPTREAAERAFRFGLQEDQVKVVGLPVAERFCVPKPDKVALKRKLQIPEDRPHILLVGGGEGMGPLASTAQAIARDCPTVSLSIITGRNKKLERELKQRTWEIPTMIHGFVQEMPDYMRASDILVTKAGPGTISEALIAGLPMILYSRLPGQEDGNVSYVVSKGAGFWENKPEKIASIINQILKSPEEYNKAITACKKSARPEAAREIAQIIAEKLGVFTTSRA
jgi:1,2-diacylglycerol 3-beta-galactosyltransferase